MTYEKFLETIKKSVEEKLGKDYELSVQPVTKNNGVCLDGLTMCPVGGNVVSVVYLNSYYDRVEAGMSAEDAAKEIVGIMREDTAAGKVAEMELTEYEKMQPKIMFKVIQAASNERMLHDVPHILFLDLAIVFYLYFEQDETEPITTLVHNSLMEAWGIREDDLWNIARVNTMKMLPATIQSMSEVGAEAAKMNLGELFDEEIMEELLRDSVPEFYMLTNQIGLYGAGCMLYDGVLKAFADSLDDDLVILPSSIHEVLLLPDRVSDPYEYLGDIVTDVNQNDVPVEDRLSDQVYKYLRETDEIVMAAGDTMMRSIILSDLGKLKS